MHREAGGPPWGSQLVGGVRTQAGLTSHFWRYRVLESWTQSHGRHQAAVGPLDAWIVARGQVPSPSSLTSSLGCRAPQPLGWSPALQQPLEPCQLPALTHGHSRAWSLPPPPATGREAGRTAVPLGSSPHPHGASAWWLQTWSGSPHLSASVGALVPMFASTDSAVSALVPIPTRHPEQLIRLKCALATSLSGPKMNFSPSIRGPLIGPWATQNLGFSSTLSAHTVQAPHPHHLAVPQTLQARPRLRPQPWLCPSPQRIQPLLLVPASAPLSSHWLGSL